MLRRYVGYVALVAACSILLTGCKKDSEVEAVLADIDAFTKELVAKVETAPNPSAGVDAAQKLMDSRSAEIREKLTSIKSVRGFQVSDQTKKKMAESITADVMKVGGLQAKYIRNSMSDPAFKRKLDKLVGDYQALFRI